MPNTNLFLNSSSFLTANSNTSTKTKNLKNSHQTDLLTPPSSSSSNLNDSDNFAVFNKKRKFDFTPFQDSNDINHNLISQIITEKSDINLPLRNITDSFININNDNKTINNKLINQLASKKKEIENLTSVLESKKLQLSQLIKKYDINHQHITHTTHFSNLKSKRIKINQNDSINFEPVSSNITNDSLITSSKSCPNSPLKRLFINNSTGNHNNSANLIDNQTMAKKMLLTHNTPNPYSQFDLSYNDNDKENNFSKTLDEFNKLNQQNQNHYNRPMTAKSSMLIDHNDDY
ncbi:uncharacterized protein ASCRUDRAFT_8255 [Ascoidea rubescens DSM 1968]|uniref:Uncharacterized protein n=1 Tax=Ascoidea rubescens DSM 1968 TaxID=1344418 RepID=A0A1D2VG21_9ASCO|nr:hypothetical protein ASCRUDRAFT_8255 [Ascoidea rubescens DSM 1968]ODV60628.1 hypothetical protein ASCRUDRAFT_8255 [Ascoidea rubescens DSM 1968]